MICQRRPPRQVAAIETSNVEMTKMKSILQHTLAATLAVAFAAPAFAASHREAPLISLDPAADNTDVYAFVSYDEDNIARMPEDKRVTFILNVNPGQDPGDGPNYFNFDDDVLYRFHIDNNADGEAEDIVYEIRFQTETRQGRYRKSRRVARRTPGRCRPRTRPARPSPRN